MALPTLAATAQAQVAPTALPTGGVVAAGQAAISQTGSTLTVTQGSTKAILNWQSFDIGSQASVTFQQPSASAIALNRVLSSDPSVILGRLTANGQVVLVNPSGIVFGGGAQVDVGGLVASTLNIKDSDFLAGTLAFQRGDANGAIVNRGTLTAADGGTIALLAPRIRNEGLIQAKLGTVALASGDAVTLATSGNGVAVKVDPATVKSQIDQGGAIVAADGQVLLTAKAANALLGGAINLGGKVEATSLSSRGGEVVLEASGPIAVTGRIDASGAVGGGTVSVVSDGATTVTGTITATGGSGAGGQAETSGSSLAIGGATITVGGAKPGSWLLDPYDLTVDASAAATIGNALATGNVTLQTTASSTSGPGTANAAGNGDIIIASPLSWSGNTTLTLNAWRNIAINANVTASGGSAGLMMNPGQGGSGTDVTGAGASVTLAGANATLSIGGNSYTLIRSAADLQATGISGYWALADNVDLSSIGNFVPIGYSSAPNDIYLTPFGGTFDGLGHTVSSLTVNIPMASGLGLFIQVGSGANVRNLGLIDASVTGGSGSIVGTTPTYVMGFGLLAGGNWGTVSNSYATGTVSVGSLAENIGGLLGYNSGIVSNCYSSASVSSGSLSMMMGGLVGQNTGVVSASFASGSVIGGGGTFPSGVAAFGGGSGIGGLVGLNTCGSQGCGTVSNSYATSAVTGGDYTGDIGGLVGKNYGGKVIGSHATGPVTGGSQSADLGGLIGSVGVGAVTNSYATGAVSGGFGADNIGGLAGLNSGTISSSYSSGAVSGQTLIQVIGGLIGANSGTLSSSYSTGQVNPGSGAADIGGLVGYNTGTISLSYATGAVNSAGAVREGGPTGPITAGGLVGYNPGGTISTSYWDEDTTGQSVGVCCGTTSGATGLTDAQMKQQVSFAGWDFTNTWTLGGSYAYPRLRAPVTWSVADSADTYGASIGILGLATLDGIASGDVGNVTAVVGLFNASGQQVSWSSGLAAGTYTEQVIGLMGSASSNYGLASSGDTVGTLTIVPKPVSWSIANGTSTYGTLAAPQVTLNGVLPGDSVTPIVTLNNGTTPLSANMSVGTYTDAVTGLAGTNAGDYQLIGLANTHGTLTITPAPLTITVNSASRPFGNGSPSLTVGYSGFVAGDTAASLTTQPSLHTTALPTSAPGTYAIVAYGAADPNYTIIYVPGALTVLNPVTGLAKSVVPATSAVSAGAFLTAASVAAGNALAEANDGNP